MDIKDDLVELRRLLASLDGDFPALPDHALELLYDKFSEIQAATWLVVNDETAARFLRWFKSGDDDDAWS